LPTLASAFYPSRPGGFFPFSPPSREMTRSFVFECRLSPSSLLTLNRDGLLPRDAILLMNHPLLLTTPWATLLFLLLGHRDVSSFPFEREPTTDVPLPFHGILAFSDDLLNLLTSWYPPFYFRRVPLPFPRTRT